MRILITGAGRGIGRAAATLLAQQGAHVGIAEIDPATTKFATDDIRQRGGKATTLVANLSEEHGFSEAAKRFADEEVLSMQ